MGHYSLICDGVKRCSGNKVLQVPAGVNLVISFVRSEIEGHNNVLTSRHMFVQNYVT